MLTIVITLSILVCLLIISALNMWYKINQLQDAVFNLKVNDIPAYKVMVDVGPSQVSVYSLLYAICRYLKIHHVKIPATVEMKED